ncbi:GAP family protein [Mycobacterium crocinum]|uniref:GAP family protein n=1 Tax=Mycolicibacterium crocinum TaxID=388459 RepID=A0ABY3TS34_9MYCO|nr:GAP family protein [Mycolicibacterium crocinum]MCV7215067.1 GAP family protein [Mycolicibacterium crocinum]ULN42129.1 GAP family protein [Mycolicibacterium crocinum]
MTTGLGSELTELIPLALVITLSPLTIIPGILMLHTPAPRPTSLAFLTGWVLGIGGLTAAFVLVSNALGGLNKQPTWAPYVRIVIGAALIAFGLYRWFTRKRSEHTPKWLTSMTSIRPPRAFVTAIVLVVVNPKVLFMCAAAGLAIGSAGLGTTGAWTADAVFTAVAASSVALPVLAYLVAGERLDEPLTKLKDWMEAQHATLVAVILVVIGVMVLYKGIHGL